MAMARASLLHSLWPGCMLYSSCHVQKDVSHGRHHSRSRGRGARGGACAFPCVANRETSTTNFLNGVRHGSFSDILAPSP